MKKEFKCNLCKKKVDLEKKGFQYGGTDKETYSWCFEEHYQIWKKQEKEFNLSDKRKIVNSDKPSTLVNSPDGYLYGYYENDIKEAVRLLKEKFMRKFYGSSISTDEYDDFLKEINEIFGDKLSK